MVNKRLADSGYKPTNHNPNESISVDKWRKMSYSEKTAFYDANPELAKQLMAKK
jgi:hypothetical protein